jgi:hypothetical protein
VQFADSLDISALLKSKLSMRPAETGLTYSSTHKIEVMDLFLSKARLAPN